MLVLERNFAWVRLRCVNLLSAPKSTPLSGTDCLRISVYIRLWKSRVVAVVESCPHVNVFLIFGNPAATFAEGRSTILQQPGIKTSPSRGMFVFCIPLVSYDQDCRLRIRPVADVSDLKVGRLGLQVLPFGRRETRGEDLFGVVALVKCATSQTGAIPLP